MRQVHIKYTVVLTLCAIIAMACTAGTRAETQTGTRSGTQTGTPRGPEIVIKTVDNETIAVMPSRPVVTSAPIVFCPDPGRETSYSISIDDGENFGGYVPMEGKNITLFPDDATSPSGRWQIKFAVEGDAGRTESDVYSVVFDTRPPAVELPDPGVIEKPLLQEESVCVRAVDDIGLARIVAVCGDDVIYEKHDITDGPAGGYEALIPLSDNGRGGGTVAVSVYDTAGNRTDISFDYMLDPEDPVIRVEGASDGAHLRQQAKIYLYAEDKHSGAFVNYTVERITRDMTESTVVSDVPDSAVIDLDDDGIYRVTAFAKDSAQRQSRAVTKSFVIDRNAPQIKIDGVSDNVDLRSPAGITVEVEDNIYEDTKVDITIIRRAFGTAETIRMDSYDLQAYRDIRAVNITTDGEYDMQVSATDSAGNTAECSRSFRIDKTAPDVAVYGLSEGEITNEKPVIRFGAGEMFYDSTVMHTLLEKKDKDGYVPVASLDRVMKQKQDHMDITVEDEGEYRLTCSASDRSGNSASAAISFTVDRTPPVIRSLDDVDNGFFRSFRLPVKIYELARDLTGAATDVFANDRKISDDDVILEEGKYILSVMARDAAGNAAEKDAVFIIDHTAPQIVLTGFDKNGNIKKGSLIEVGLFDEADILKQVTFNGRNIAIDADNKARIAVDEYGSYNLAVVAVDNAGNVTDTEIYTSCNMVSPVFGDVIRSERTIRVPEDADEPDMVSLLIGLGTLLTGTFGLTWRGYIRN